MSALKQSALEEATRPQLFVVHPLDDAPEPKCSAEGLGLMHLSRATRALLLGLRLYLIAMTLILLFRCASVGLGYLHGAR